MTTGAGRGPARLIRLILVAVLIRAAVGAPASAHEPIRIAPPAGVTEVPAPWPLETSGVAAVPGGYLVVGDDDDDHGHIWPGGKPWPLPPALRGVESVDVGFGPDGVELWLALAEASRTLADSVGGRYVFDKRFAQLCSRGLEGLALRWHNDGWDAAVVWEGGYVSKSCIEPPPGTYLKPRVAILRWIPGRGADRPPRVFDLDPPHPAEAERFRVTDLVWQGDSLLVLLSSKHASRHETYRFTWLQEFDLRGRPVGEPLKLEERWGTYRDGKNWEALDWTLDGRLVMGYDAKTGHRALAVFPYP